MRLIVGLEHRLVAAEAIDPIQPGPGDAGADRIRRSFGYEAETTETKTNIAVRDHGIGVVETKLEKARYTTIVAVGMLEPDALRAEGVKSLGAVLTYARMRASRTRAT